MSADAEVLKRGQKNQWLPLPPTLLTLRLKLVRDPIVRAIITDDL